jgi:hypothetical protein
MFDRVITPLQYTPSLSDIGCAKKEKPPRNKRKRSRSPHNRWYVDSYKKENGPACKSSMLE